MNKACQIIGPALGLSPAVVYEYQRQLVRIGVLSLKDKGPGGGVRATPRDVSVLLIGLMSAQRLRLVANEVHQLETLKRTEHWERSETGEPKPLPEAPEWPASSKPTLGLALAALLKNPAEVVKVEAIELIPEVQRAVIHLSDRGREHEYRFGHRGTIDFPPLLDTKRLNGRAIWQISRGVFSGDATTDQGDTE